MYSSDLVSVSAVEKPVLAVVLAELVELYTLAEVLVLQPVYCVS